MLLTSALCGAVGGADGGSGGSGLQGCRRFIQEVCAGTLLIPPPLVLVQPLVQDLDHSVLFQDLSVKSTDPEKQTNKQKTCQEADVRKMS